MLGRTVTTTGKSDSAEVAAEQSKNSPDQNVATNVAFLPAQVRSGGTFSFMTTDVMSSS